MRRAPNNNRSGLTVFIAGMSVVVIVMILVIGALLVGRANTPVTPPEVLALPSETATVPVTPSATLTPSETPTQTNTPKPGATTAVPTAIPPTATATSTPVPADTATPSQTPDTTINTSGVVKLPNFKPVGKRSIYIPRLGLERAIPIIELPFVGNTWDVDRLGHSAGHLEKTSWLGDSGNVVIVGHIQLTVRDFGPFLNLKNMIEGDIVVIAEEGKMFAYQVTDIERVAPTAVEVTYPTEEPMLTLLTCTAWDVHRGVFAKRLVVRAKRVTISS
jgi:LPXTG-site transpeptidase (sortase) family protein